MVSSMDVSIKPVSATVLRPQVGYRNQAPAD